MKIITSSYLYMLHTNINKILIKYTYKDIVLMRLAMMRRTPNPPPPHPPLVIRNSELSEISNEEEDTSPHILPTLGH